MPPASQPTGILQAIPTALLVVLALAGIALWVSTHLWARGALGRRGEFFPVRVLIGGGALWLTLVASTRFLVLATSWSLWVPAVVGALAAEVVLFLYGLERRSVTRTAGLVLGGLRLALALLVVIMLSQPTLSRDSTRTLERYVAVLLDDSTSMHLTDFHMNPAEKLQLARLLVRDSSLKPPYSLDGAALGDLSRQLVAQSDWLELLGNADFKSLGRHISNRRAEMQKLFGDVERLAGQQREALQTALKSTLPLDQPTRKDIEDIAERLHRQAQAPAAEMLKVVQGTPEEVAKSHRTLIATGRSIAQSLQPVAATYSSLNTRFDAAYFSSLSEEKRREVDAAVQKTRQAIQRAALLESPDGEPSVLEKLQEKYYVKMYRFASRPQETDVQAWRSEIPVAAYSSADLSAEPAASQSTDFAAALKKVQADIPPDMLAGVLVLSDGRHNGRESFEETALRLGGQKSPVCSVLIGSSRARSDAAVASLDAPESVYLEDKLIVRAHLKLDGLNGKEAKVRLERDTVVVDEKTVRISGDSFRAVVELGDTPQEKGLHNYQVKIEPFEEELLRENNVRETHVVVSDDRTKLLIIDGRPRWEFRYVRNLFAGRDQSVQLQHVLLQPDTLADTPAPAKTPASAARPPEEREATELPATEEEWLKFDVIILGDVAPRDLGEEHLHSLEKFVGERGGTLIVIAGPQFMPGAYADSRLQELLPINFVAQSPDTAGTTRSRIALADAGRSQLMMRLSDSAEENQRVWGSVPELDWRFPVQDTKAGAVVLAFAMPLPPPAFFEPKAAASPHEAEQITRQRQEFERKNALIAYHKYALGQVMMLNFDQTWRLRYRVGDTYHHRFWGQMLRWATADKLPVGTVQVRLGTNRILYPPDEPVIVRAKLVDTDHSPVISKDVTVKVFEDQRLVMQHKLAYQQGSAGMYIANLGSFVPNKNYRVELEGADIRRLLAEENVTTLQSEFRVAATSPTELIELGADRSALDQMAQLSGGAVATPAEAAGLLKHLGSGIQKITEHRQIQLWNSWPLLAILVLLVTVEWVLRKRTGLV